MGGVVDTIGDVVGGTVDALGNVVGGVGDVVGDVGNAVGNVVEDIDPVTLAKIAYTLSTGDPSLALEDMTAEEIGSTLASDALDYGNISPDVVSNVGADSFNASSFLPGSNPYDPIKDISNYTKYAKDAYNLYNMLNNDQQSQIQNQYQQNNLYDPTSGNFDYGNILGQFVNSGQNAYNKYNLLNSYAGLSPTNFNPMDILGNLSTSALKDLTTLPGAAATGLGLLSIYDQKRVNDLVQKGYDENKAKQAVYQQKFTTPEGIASLPQQNITGLTPRTTADVVSRPKAAKGGSINDLYGEYSELNNRMRNYRRLAKGGLI